MKAFLVFTLTETSFATTSYSFEFFLLVCKSGLQIVHYILRMSRYTNIVYIGRYLVLTYIKRFISTVCCFFSYICWSVNCLSPVSKFNNFFWHAGKLRQDLYMRALILSFMESSFLTLRYFFAFFICKFFKGFFQPPCQSVNCISWVFESWNILWTCPVT